MNRIIDHPVLGPAEERQTVRFFYNGKAVSALEGEPLAAALLAAGVRVFRRTAKGSPRSLFCGIGHCTDCSMTVDGVPNVRTCITAAVEGMRVEDE